MRGVLSVLVLLGVLGVVAADAPSVCDHTVVVRPAPPAPPTCSVAVLIIDPRVPPITAEIR